MRKTLVWMTGVASMLALDERVSRQGAISLRRNQEYKKYRSVEEALSDNGLQLDKPLVELLTTESSWFQIDVAASFATGSALIRTVVYRDPENGVTRVLYRTQARPIKVD